MITIWLSLLNKIKTFISKFELFFITLFFAIITLVITYPSIFHLSNKLIGDGGDNYQYFGFQYITAQKIKKLEYPFSHSDIFRYPIGFSFQLGYDSVLSTLLGGLLSVLINNILAYNLTIILLLILNCLFSYIFFSHISKNKIGALIGAIMYGFSFYVIARSAGHINLMFVGGFPLFLYSVLKLIKTNWSKKNILIFYFSFFLVFIGSFQYFIILIISIFFTIPFFYIFFREKFILFLKNILITKKTLIICFLPFAFIFFIIAFPYLNAFLKKELISINRTNNLIEYSPSLINYVIPNQFLSNLLITEFFGAFNNSLISIERTVYLGWIELILFIIFLLVEKNKKFKIFASSSILLFFILSLGFYNEELKIYLPYRILYNFFPFSYIPEAGRFFIIFYLIMITCVVFFIKKSLQFLNNKKKLKIFYIVFIFGLIMLERLPKNFWLSPIIADRNYTKIVRQLKGTAVLDIPVDIYFSNSTYNILPYAYNKKIISGYFHYLANTLQSQLFFDHAELKRFACGYENIRNLINPYNSSRIISKRLALNKKLINQLKENNIFTIVVHKNDPIDHAKYYFPECAGARIETSILLPQLYKPDPSDKQKILSLFFPTIPQLGDTIIFEADGTFYLDGIHAYPYNWLPLHFFLDGQEISIKQAWTDRGEGNATFDPFIKIEVKKGSKISFRFDKNNNKDYSFIKIWYRYKIKKSANISDYSDYFIEKIYEDDDAAIFTIK